MLSSKLKTLLLLVEHAVCLLGELLACDRVRQKRYLEVYLPASAGTTMLLSFTYEDRLQNKRSDVSSFI